MSILELKFQQMNVAGAVRPSHWSYKAVLQDTKYQLIIFKVLNFKLFTSISLLGLESLFSFFNMWLWCHFVERMWPHVNRSTAGCGLSCHYSYASWIYSHLAFEPPACNKGLSRDNVPELVLYSTHNLLHKGIKLIHDFKTKMRISFTSLLWVHFLLGFFFKFYMDEGCLFSDSN